MRPVLAKGARGELVRQLQANLKQAGRYKGTLDGDYGDGTAKAVTEWRKTSGLKPPSPVVDPSTWEKLMGRPVPPLRERALQVTAAFEGHGFTLAQGNFDGAGLTWGVIGFTLSSGEVQQIVLDAASKGQGLVQKAFGKQTNELVQMMKAPRTKQMAWADRLSLGKSKARLAEPWRSGFARFGELPAVQALQLARVDTAYYKPALQTAKALGLKTELGAALCFDIHVQNGGIRASAAAEIGRVRGQHPIHIEQELRVIVAHAVANASRAAYRQDVLSRKLTLATGTGTVHGATYVVRNWGLADVPA